MAVNNRFDATVKILEEARASSDSVLVSYSGGKDSIAVLDLCSRYFKRVEGLFMYLLPDLDCVEARLAWARETFGLKIHQYPHWVLRNFLFNGIYCNNHHSLDDLPEYKLADVYDLAKQDTGISLIANGAKKSDSMWRRQALATWQKDMFIAPLMDWSKLDVLAYLKMRKLPIPESESANTNASGLDLSTPSLLWLHDRWPRDFERVCQVFPYARAVVYRREWYGVAA